MPIQGRGVFAIYFDPCRQIKYSHKKQMKKALCAIHYRAKKTIHFYELIKQ